MTAEISVIVVTYDSSEEIAACLEPLVGQVAQVIVVDNASGDDTPSLVRGRFPSVELIANPDNVGFARAVNQGIRRARRGVVVMLNPDCVVEPGALARMAEHLQAEPAAGIVAPRIIDGSGATAISVHPFETLGSVIASRFGGSLLPVAVRHRLSRGKRRDAYEVCLAGTGPQATTVDWASGACLAVRAELLERLGGLHEGYFMYYEDEELCLHAARMGARVAYLPAARVRHIGAASSPDPTLTWPWLYASMLLFFARNRPGSFVALRGVLAARATLGAAAAGVRGRHRAAGAWLRVLALALRGPVPVQGAQL